MVQGRSSVKLRQFVHAHDHVCIYLQRSLSPLTTDGLLQTGFWIHRLPSASDNNSLLLEMESQLLRYE
jgi:hypothetical protein